jgi:hypothetical protein
MCTKRGLAGTADRHSTFRILSSSAAPIRVSPMTLSLTDAVPFGQLDASPS